MSPDERRAMIVQVAIPLVAEHGYGVSTQQIARAAGIGEATIFRAFSDKDTLLQACIAEAVRPDHLLRELATISLETPLQERLVEAAEALAAHLGRIGAVVGALHASGMPRRADGERPVPANSREESFASTNAAIVELLEPDRDRFRLPLESFATAFGYLLMSLGRAPQGPGGTPPLDAAGLVDMLLHGALTPTD
jgi:AcrR family transcriptional regulator